MTILKIEQGINNKILRTTSKKVDNILDPEVQTLISNMEETLKSLEIGIGLAAPQVGKNLRIFIAKKSVSSKTVFINPKIIFLSKKNQEFEEGCLSIPDLKGMVKRSIKIKIEAFNKQGRKFRITGENLLARLIQHEIDHLDGILFIDKAETLYKLEDKSEIKNS